MAGGSTYSDEVGWGGRMSAAAGRVLEQLKQSGTQTSAQGSADGACSVLATLAATTISWSQAGP
jgi:hypothetical protein